MHNIKVKYRTYYKAIPPKRIKLDIPGWAGTPDKQVNGNKPQPWHCVPFVEGSTYGLELIYPFESECKVFNENDKLRFEGDFNGENPWGSGPPFSNFAPNHYGFTSSLDIQAPDGYVVRLEPHPRFFTDTIGTVPIVVPGHINSWWAKIFFIVFKAPRPGEVHIFRKNEPYAQVLIVPQKVNYELSEMNEFEAANRAIIDAKISSYGKLISKNSWQDHQNNTFDDKYKQLAKVFAKEGEIESYLLNLANKEMPKKLPPRCVFGIKTNGIKKKKP